MNSLLDDFKVLIEIRDTCIEELGRNNTRTMFQNGLARGFALAIDTIVCKGVSEKNKDISLSELNEIRMLAKKEELL